MTFSNKQTILYVIMILSVLITVCAPFVGMHTISFRAILDSAGHGMAHDIFWRIRVPRVCAAFVAGAGLSVSGMVFQAMFRNLLATPFTMGVASGASLGAAIFVHIGGTMTLWCYSGVSLAAFSGALVSIGLVYGLSGIRRKMPAATMLLAGVAVSFFFSSLILFIQYMSSFSHSFQIVRWLMGAIDIVGFGAITTMLPVVAAGSALILFLTRELNLLMAGEDFSISRGVDIARTRKLLFLAASLIVGSIVAICGPIGFVGMMAPHICRLMIGADHRYLAWASLFFGGAFLAFCDTLARTIIAPAQMPVGIITALLGGPFFIWLLVKSGSKPVL